MFLQKHLSFSLKIILYYDDGTFVGVFTTAGEQDLLAGSASPQYFVIMLFLSLSRLLASVILDIALGLTSISIYHFD